nr:module 1 specificity determinant [Pseudomonas aeruginosa]WHT11951.1 module 1 specificity determinant [Pseudomonas aeruginosa]
MFTTPTIDYASGLEYGCDMTTGLQIWDANGNLTTDTATRVGTILGSVESGTSPGSISVPDLSLGNPFCYVLTGASVYGDVIPPSVTFSGNTLSWGFYGGGSYTVRVSAKIVYGVF